MVRVVDPKTRHLVAQAKDGDEGALNELCRLCAPRVHCLVRLRMGQKLRSRMESMDLVQDVLYAVLRDLGNFTYENEGDFLRWLSRIVENRLRDHVDGLHAQKRDIRREVPLGGYESSTQANRAVPAQPTDTKTPSAVVSEMQEYARLEEALDGLRPEYRQVILLTKIEGLSYKEVGERLGRSSEAARALVARAMTALASAFRSV
jgi:RNA polymerase sigma-70 factor (ECF subfamily)